VSVIPAPERSVPEQRLMAIGTSGEDRTILVVFTLRERDGNQFIRPVSARFMHEKERRHYEKQVANVEENARPQE
jgi:uncharacterized DUF497 family protein